MKASLNDLPVFCAEIKNAFLQDPSSEKHYIICDTQFGLQNEGGTEIIVKDLYGGNSAGADYWCHV